MTIHEDALRDLAANHGWGFCDAVADELNELEAAYASLFKTHGELQRALDAKDERIRELEGALRGLDAELQELDYKFLSANSVQVERATIKAEEWGRVWSALKRAREALK